MDKLHLAKLTPALDQKSKEVAEDYFQESSSLLWRE
jgi:hypothetical protein